MRYPADDSAAGANLLSWEDTARDMAASEEDWSDLDSTLADDLDEVPWDDDAPGTGRSWSRG